MALGALLATTAAKTPHPLSGGHIPILGFDALPEALASVRDGGLAATVEQFPGGQSRGAMNRLVKYLRGGTQPISPSDRSTTSSTTASRPTSSSPSSPIAYKSLSSSACAPWRRDKLVLLTPITITKDNINDAERLGELN